MKLILEVNTECAASITDARTVLDFLMARGQVVVAEEVVEKKQPVATAEKKPASTTASNTAKDATPTKSPSEKKPAATAAAKSEPSATTVADAPTIEELTKVVQALTLSGNRAKLLEILKEYDAPKASAIPVELQREFINKCQAVLDV